MESSLILGNARTTRVAGKLVYTQSVLGVNVSTDTPASRGTLVTEQHEVLRALEACGDRVSTHVPPSAGFNAAKVAATRASDREVSPQLIDHTTSSSATVGGSVASLHFKSVVSLSDLIFHKLPMGRQHKPRMAALRCHHDPRARPLEPVVRYLDSPSGVALARPPPRPPIFWRRPPSDVISTPLGGVMRRSFSPDLWTPPSAAPNYRRLVMVPWLVGQFGLYTLSASYRRPPLATLRSFALNGANGEVTGTDDMEKEEKRSLGLITRRRNSAPTAAELIRMSPVDLSDGAEPESHLIIEEAAVPDPAVWNAAGVKRILGAVLAHPPPPGPVAVATVNNPIPGPPTRMHPTHPPHHRPHSDPVTMHFGCQAVFLTLLLFLCWLITPTAAALVPRDPPAPLVEIDVPLNWSIPLAFLYALLYGQAFMHAFLWPYNAHQARHGRPPLGFQRPVPDLIAHGVCAFLTAYRAINSTLALWQTIFLDVCVIICMFVLACGSGARADALRFTTAALVRVPAPQHFLPRITLIASAPLVLCLYLVLTGYMRNVMFLAILAQEVYYCMLLLVEVLQLTDFSLALVNVRAAQAAFQQANAAPRAQLPPQFRRDVRIGNRYWMLVPLLAVLIPGTAAAEITTNAMQVPFYGLRPDTSSSLLFLVLIPLIFLLPRYAGRGAFAPYAKVLSVLIMAMAEEIVCLLHPVRLLVLAAEIYLDWGKSGSRHARRCAGHLVLALLAHILMPLIGARRTTFLVFLAHSCHNLWQLHRPPPVFNINWLTPVASNPNRPYNMDIGQTAYVADLWEVDITIGDATGRWVLSRTLYLHLCSVTVGCLPNDPISTVMARLETIARNFVLLEYDVVTATDHGWVRKTIKAAAEWHKQDMDSLWIPEQPLLLAVYGYSIEDVTKAIPAHEPMTIQLRGDPVLIEDKAPVSQIVGWHAPALSPKPDRKDPLAQPAAHLARASRLHPPMVRMTEYIFFQRFHQAGFRARHTQLRPDDIPTLDEWLANSNYPTSRQNELRKAWESLALKPLEARDFRVKQFIKDESYQDYKFPRMINSYSDRVKCVFGRYCYAVDKRYFADLKSSPDPCTIKYLPAHKWPAHFAEYYEARPNLRSTDGTSFESSHASAGYSGIHNRIVSFAEFWHEEHCWLLEYCPAALEDFQRWGRYLIDPEFAISNMGLFSWPGALSSGSYFTSGDNHRLMHYTGRFLVNSKLNRPLGTWERIGITEGDDMLWCLPDGVEIEPTDFASVGMTVVLTKPDSLTTAGFCGVFFHPDSHALLIDPTVFLMDFPIIPAHIPAARLPMLMLAKAMSAHYMYNGCPIVSIAARETIARYSGHLPRFLAIHKEMRELNDWERRQLYEAVSFYRDHPPRPILDCDRALIETHFGVTITAQHVTEAALRRGDRVLPDVLPWPTPCRDYYTRYALAPRYPMGTRVAYNWSRAGLGNGPLVLSAPLLVLLLIGGLIALNLAAQGMPALKSFGASPNPDRSILEHLPMNGKSTQASKTATPQDRQKERLLAKATALRSAISRSGPPAGPPPRASSDPGRATPRPRVAQSQKGTGQGRGLARLGAPQSLRTGPHVTGGPARRAGIAVSPPVWLKQQRSLLPSKLTSLNERGEEVPLAQAFELPQQLHHLEPRVDYSSKYISFKGSELMMEVGIPPTIGGATSTIPRGGVMGVIPMNPLYCDGLRVARSLSQFDQFRIRSITIEYVPTCPATQAGGLMMAVFNDPNDLIGVEGGFSAMRDLLTRTGAIAFSPYTGAACSQGDSLLKWYFTQSEANPEQSMPGMCYVITATDISNATASAVPLGLIWMHYEFEVRAPSIERQMPQTYALASASIQFNAAINNGSGVSVAAGVVPSPFQNVTSIGWGTIVAADDVAAGSSTWRQWTDLSTGQVTTFGVGNVLYWRSFVAGASYITYFYSTLANALGTNNYGYTFTVTQGALVRGFKLWNIGGSNLSGDA